MGDELSPTVKLEADPVWAPVIRRIFKPAREGEGACNLAARLHAEGLKSPRGKLWSKATILHILRNPVYTGTLVWGSRRTGLQVHKVADPVRVEDAWEALVSVEDFQQVQLRIAERSREVIQPNILRSSYLLSGILFCGHCGHPFIGHPAKGGQHHYYGCQRKMKSGAKACTAKLLRQELVEEAVVAELRDAVLDPLYLKALLEQVNEELRQAGAGEGEELESIRGQEAEVRRKLDRLYEALESGTMELDLLAPRLREWKTRLAELEARAAALKGKGQLHYLADEATVRRYLESLHSLLEQGSMAQRRSFLRAWVQRIDATGYELRLTCTLPPLPEEAPLRAAAGAEKQAARAGARPKKQEAEPVVNEVLPRGKSGSPIRARYEPWRHRKAA